MLEYPLWQPCALCGGLVCATRNSRTGFVEIQLRQINSSAECIIATIKPTQTLSIVWYIYAIYIFSGPLWINLRIMTIFLIDPGVYGYCS